MDEQTRKGLFFLGNMLMPQETHIIRLGAGTPKVFAKDDKFLSKRRDLLCEGYYLPSPGVVVEDQHSAIGFVDLQSDGEKGVGKPRLYIYIEGLHGNIEANSIADLVKAVAFKLTYPADTLFTAWGMINDVSNLNIEAKPVAIQASPWGIALFNGERVFHSMHSDWFNQYLNRAPLQTEENSELFKLMHVYGNALGQNLQQAMLQVAYHNAITESQG